MYAIRNKKTGKWLYGTDYNYSPNRQRTDPDQALTFSDKHLAKSQFENRKCNNDYEIVKVSINVAEN